MKKSILILILLSVSLSSFSQSKKAMKKIEAKATELVEKINNEIVAGDKSLTLSDSQKEQIKKIHTERIVGLRKLGKEATKEDKKAFNKKYYQKIYKEILSKKQLKARRKGKLKKEQ